MSPSLRIKILKIGEVFLLTFNLLRTYYPPPRPSHWENFKDWRSFHFPSSLAYWVSLPLLRFQTQSYEAGWQLIYDQLLQN